MTEHEIKAVEYFVKGYNCSQSVVAAFSDLTGLSEEISLKVSSSFGAGIGHLRLTCGAVTGMVTVLGLLYGYSDLSDPDAKAKHYARVRELTDRFLEIYPTLSCKELLEHLATAPVPTDGDPQERTAEYYKTRPCVRFVASAARILDEYIEDQG